MDPKVMDPNSAVFKIFYKGYEESTKTGPQEVTTSAKDLRWSEGHPATGRQPVHSSIEKGTELECLFSNVGDDKQDEWVPVTFVGENSDKKKNGDYVVMMDPAVMDTESAVFKMFMFYDGKTQTETGPREVTASATDLRWSEGHPATGSKPGLVDRRRLSNQNLIDRFIRESIRCIES